MACEDCDPVYITGGVGIVVGGSGTISDPYVVERSGDDVLIVGQDTPTVTLTVVGSGLPGDPFIISAVASMRLQDLSDVNDPGGPGIGDVPVWGATGWQFAPPPVVAPGAVNTIPGGLVGDGSFGDPMGINVSNIIENSVLGTQTYIGTDGKLYAIAPTGIVVAWADITGKPTAFPPASHSASLITSGTLDAARIAAGSLDASVIGTGVLAAARVPKVLALNGLTYGTSAPGVLAVGDWY